MFAMIPKRRLLDRGRDAERLQSAGESLRAQMECRRKSVSLRRRLAQGVS